MSAQIMDQPGAKAHSVLLPGAGAGSSAYRTITWAALSVVSPAVPPVPSSPRGPSIVPRVRARPTAWAPG
jgi:hypothetical protein